MNEPVVRLSGSPDRPAPGAIPPGPGWWREAALAVVAALVGYGLALPLPFGPSADQVPGDPGDSRFVHYLLEHVWGWLSGQPLHASFWRLPIFFPSPARSFLYSDVVAGFAPPYLAARALGADPIAAYVVWLVVSLTLCFLATYAVCRLLGGGVAGSVAGGFLNAFAASRMQHLVHPQLVATFFPVVALALFVAAWRADAKARVEALPGAHRFGPADWLLAGVGATIALQFWAAFYPGFFTLLIGAIATLVALVLRAARGTFIGFLRARWRGAVVAAVLFVAIAGPLGYHYTRVLSTVDPPRWEEWAKPNLARPWSWVVVGGRSHLYDWTRWTDTVRGDAQRYEQPLGLGFGTTLAAIAGLALYRRRGAATAVVTVTTVAVIVIATGWGPDLAPWKLVYAFVPGANVIRVPARVGLFLPLAGAIGVGFLVTALTAGRRRFAAALVAAVVVAEQLGRPATYSAAEDRAAIELITRMVEPEAEAFALLRSSKSPPFVVLQVDAMWAAHALGRQTVNGYSGNVAPGWPVGLLDGRAVTDEKFVSLDREIHAWVVSQGADPDRTEVIRMPRDYRDAERLGVGQRDDRRKRQESRSYQGN